MKIEQGFEIPKGKNQDFKWPFSEMSVGDSFAFNSLDSRKCASSAVRFSKKHGGNFSIRKHGDGHRCWRIK